MALASKTPTQMGSTVSLFASFRITMGVLLTGSTSRPRILISTSIGSSLHPVIERSGHRAISDDECPVSFMDFVSLVVKTTHRKGHQGTRRENSDHQFTHQAVWERGGDAHRHVAAEFQIAICRKV